MKRTSAGVEAAVKALEALGSLDLEFAEETLGKRGIRRAK